MSRKISSVAIVFLGVAMLSLVGLRLAVSAPHDGSANRSTPAVTADDTSGLDGLGAADRAAAEKQKTCPVTDALLGSMGTPVKVKVKGREVFLCCAGCKGKLLKNPDKYLEKLDKKS